MHQMHLEHANADTIRTSSDINVCFHHIFPTKKPPSYLCEGRAALVVPPYLLLLFAITGLPVAAYWAARFPSMHAGLLRSDLKTVVLRTKTFLDYLYYTAVYTVCQWLKGSLYLHLQESSQNYARA